MSTTLTVKEPIKRTPTAAAGYDEIFLAEKPDPEDEGTLRAELWADGQLAGWVKFDNFGTYAYLLQITVEPKFRRRGYATALLNWLSENYGSVVVEDLLPDGQALMDAWHREQGRSHPS